MPGTIWDSVPDAEGEAGWACHQMARPWLPGSYRWKLEARWKGGQDGGEGTAALLRALAETTSLGFEEEQPSVKENALSTPQPGTACGRDRPADGDLRYRLCCISSFQVGVHWGSESLWGQLVTHFYTIN